VTSGESGLDEVAAEKGGAAEEQDMHAAGPAVAG
jgi:hypothetical protein